LEKQILLDEDSWICKDNRLVNATYKLNIGELKLILAISSMVNPFDEEFKDYMISIKDFAKLLEVNLSTNKNFYSRIKRASGLLLSKRVTIHEKDGDFQTVWLSGIKYYDNEGKVAVSFHPKLKKYYIQLQAYTKYRLKNITNLNSEYSLKFYEGLKQYEKIGVRIYELKELKKFLGVEKLYDRFYDFKRRILLVTQKEISAKTDISFEFEEIKEGRNIKAIKFYIKNNCKDKANDEVAVTSEEEQPIKKIVDLMCDHKITTLEAKKIYNSSKGNIDVIHKVYNHFKNKKADNFIGLLISQVRPGVFKEDKKNYNKGVFNDFLQHGYTPEQCIDMEKKLLGD